MLDTEWNDAKQFWMLGVWITVGILIIILIIWGSCAVGNVYNVWSSAKEGEARLAEATYSRQIAVKEADAKAAAATELAKAAIIRATGLGKAEIIRAKGVAAANKIIGDSLNENESYLRYLWIQTLESQNNKVIYVPTEANLPILEAGRLKHAT